MTHPNEPKPQTAERTHPVSRLYAATVYRKAFAYIEKWLVDHAGQIAALDAAETEERERLEKELIQCQAELARVCRKRYFFGRPAEVKHEIIRLESRLRVLQIRRDAILTRRPPSVARWVKHWSKKLERQYGIVSIVMGETIELPESEIADLHSMATDMAAWLRRMEDVRKVEQRKESES